MALELTSGPMAVSMKDTGRRISCTDRGSTRGLTVESMMVSMKMIRKTEKARFTGQMVACTAEAGDRVNSMAKPPFTAPSGEKRMGVWEEGKRIGWVNEFNSSQGTPASQVESGKSMPV